MNATSALGWALLHFLWQGALIALAARLLLAVLPRRRAPVRYAAAVAALALMPAAVAYSTLRGIERTTAFTVAESVTEVQERAPTSLPTGIDAPRAALEAGSARGDASVLAATVAAGQPSWRQRIEGALAWIVGAWALGVVALAARLLASYSAVRRLVRVHAEPVPEAVTAMLARLAHRLGVRRVVRVSSSCLTHVPAVAGWCAPVVLLPASALTGLSRTELEAILAHELAHVKRNDYLVNLLQTLIETLLFYHPAVWWLGARIREEREHCCDDLAVAACGSAPLYAEALLSMERLRGERAPELALALSGGSLLARVERLLAPRARTAELFPRWIAGASAVAIVLVLGATSELASAAQGRREPVRAAQVPTGVDGVLVHPDPAQSLATRNDWAMREASRRGYREFWIGHSIAAMPAFAKGILIGRFDHTGGLVVSGTGDDQVTLSGGTLSMLDPSSVSLPGEPLAPLVQADPADIGVLYLWSARGNRPGIRRVHLATAALAVDFEGLPLLWLGRAEDGESVPDALARINEVQTPDLRQELVAVVGAHATSSIVTPELMRLLASRSDDAEMRGNAAEWLAYHPNMEALGALDRAARGDRSEIVRGEAAEAVSEMRFGPAFDVLVALTRELTDTSARSEAVEGLGLRTEPGAVSALLDVANGDPDPDVRCEAVETLGEVPEGAGMNALAALCRSHPETALRVEAVETYGECAPADEAIGFLQDLAQRDSASDVRREAVETLGEIHDERVVEILAGLAERGEDTEVQCEAVETLGETIAGAATAPVLERIARSHPALDVQREAVETLGDLHDEHNHVLDIVEALASDHPTDAVRAEAVETLGDHMAPARAAALFERLLRSERSPLVRKELREAQGELEERGDD